MKLQYLGDSKDSFKWDYHDHLTSMLRLPRLTIALMLTPDDRSGHGKTKAEWFPAIAPVVQFCRELQVQRNIEYIRQLPSYTGSRYDVSLHQGTSHLICRSDFFSGFDGTIDQVVLVDPDTGFEPETACGAAHVAYRDVHRILDQLNERSIVSVFQYYRRKAFAVDFARIRERLGEWPATALHWHSLMFVAVARSREAIGRVRDANVSYARSRPVSVITGD